MHSILGIKLNTKFNTKFNAKFNTKFNTGGACRQEPAKREAASRRRRLAPAGGQIKWSR